MARTPAYRNYAAAISRPDPAPTTRSSRHAPPWRRRALGFIAVLGAALLGLVHSDVARVGQNPCSPPAACAAERRLPPAPSHAGGQKPRGAQPRRRGGTARTPQPLNLIKVGDSLTTSPHFLGCLEHPTALSDLEPTRRRFAGRGLLSRKSRSAGVGWNAGHMLRGTPTPLDREIRAISPDIALVLLGTNDVQLRHPRRFEKRLGAILDRLKTAKVRAVMSTIPPRAGNAWAERQVPIYNAIIRKLARNRSLPLIELHEALVRIPGQGLTRDGVHLDVYRHRGRARACDFSPRGLRHGHNVRNLLTLKALAGLRQ